MKPGKERQSELEKSPGSNAKTKRDTFNVRTINQSQIMCACVSPTAITWRHTSVVLGAVDIESGAEIEVARESRYLLVLLSNLHWDVHNGCHRFFWCLSSCKLVYYRSILIGRVYFVICPASVLPRSISSVGTRFHPRFFVLTVSCSRQLRLVVTWLVLQAWEFRVGVLPLLTNMPKPGACRQNCHRIEPVSDLMFDSFLFYRSRISSDVPSRCKSITSVPQACVP